jgi:hypothetical protein
MGNEAEPRGERTTALVVEAEPPLDNLVKVGKRSHGSVRILVGEGPDRIYTLGGRHKRDKEHWLVPGMEVPVTIDPAHPDAFEILWDEIPSMAERAAANEPALADPIGTRRKVNEAVISATSAIDTSAMPSELAEAVAEAQGESARSPDTVGEQLAQAEQEPAPAGLQRAVVLVATSIRKLATEGDATGSDHRYETSQGKHDAVLSVHLPGQEPYAVYIEKLRQPRKSALARGVGIPALVSLSDPTDIELDWNGAEAAGQAQLGQRMQAASEKMEAAQQMMGGGPTRADGRAGAGHGEGAGGRHQAGPSARHADDPPDQPADAADDDPERQDVARQHASADARDADPAVPAGRHRDRRPGQRRRVAGRPGGHSGASRGGFERQRLEAAAARRSPSARPRGMRTLVPLFGA